MNGTITVTPTTITWFSDQSPFTEDMFTLSGGTGSFASENGQNGVMNLDIATEPVGSPIAAEPTFITFDVTAGLPNLLLTLIAAGTGGAAGCAAPPAINEMCTPPNPGGSPFTFTDDSLNTSDAKFVFSGVTSDHLSTWTIVFTSQFTQPYQNVLAAFGPGGAGFVSNAYSSAELTLAPAVVPEPATLVFLGLGLIGIGVLRKFRKAS